MHIGLRQWVVFLHVAGMIGIAAVVTIEWISVRSLMRATTYEEARQGMALSPLLPRVAAPSFLLVLASGIYLATNLAAWRLAWVATALPTLAVVAIAGAVIGPRRARIRAATATGIGPLTEDAQVKLRDPMILA